jgi:hypothetical protein
MAFEMAVSHVRFGARLTGAKSAWIWRRSALESLLIPLYGLPGWFAALDMGREFNSEPPLPKGNH